MRKKKSVYEIDIHGMTEIDAYCSLIECLNRLPSDADRLVVVHGYHGGQVLKNMVKNLVHYRVSDILQSFSNEGETTLYLNKNKR